MDVFNGICPPEQVWKIQLLEIDLGVIDYTDLESGLSMNLREQLTKNLTDLVIYPNKSNNNIEILNESVSYIQLVSYFLLHGFILWSYKPADQSINEVLEQLLQNEYKMVIAMLKEIGVTHENVRKKRIAWQYKRG